MLNLTQIDVDILLSMMVEVCGGIPVSGEPRDVYEKLLEAYLGYDVNEDDLDD